MKKTFTTIAAVMTVLFLASTTVSAQEKKIEKKITVVTVNDGEKTVIDTTIVLNDNAGNRMHKSPVPGAMPGMRGMKGMKGPKGMMNMNMMAPMPQEMEGVNYRISIDGVTVNIRAPKEKSKEADRILAEVKKILEAK